MLALRYIFLKVICGSDLSSYLSLQVFEFIETKQKNYLNLNSYLSLNLW